MQPADHGSDYARMTTSESTGYAKAMLDCIDWLTHLADLEPGDGDDFGLRVCAAELTKYRNAKLSAPMQPKLTAPHAAFDPYGEWKDRP